MADPVAPSFADWLKATALYATSADDGSAWGDKAVETEIISPLAFKPDALTEAARQLEVLGGPLAVDEHVVSGRHIAMLGKSVRVAGDRLGYENGAQVFVIGATEQANGTTVLTVLKRL